jgi:hypothetical protein
MLVAAAPSFAQGTQKATDANQKPSQTAVQFVREQTPQQWSAQALIGRTIYNLENDELGEINNVILTEDGRVAAVTIGVGGFLGLGEKDVGVPFSALVFRKADQMASGQQAGGKNTSMAAQQPRGEVKTGDRNASSDRSMAASDRNTSASDRSMSAADRTTQDRSANEHENVRIYLNANKDQLKNAPDFEWLDEDA